MPHSSLEHPLRGSSAGPLPSPQRISGWGSPGLNPWTSSLCPSLPGVSPISWVNCHSQGNDPPMCVPSWDLDFRLPGLAACSATPSGCLSSSLGFSAVVHPASVPAASVPSLVTAPSSQELGHTSWNLPAPLLPASENTEIPVPCPHPHTASPAWHPHLSLPLPVPPPQAAREQVYYSSSQFVHFSVQPSPR